MKIRGLVVAAAQSGAGKTTLSCALAAAFRQKGLRVGTFKVGPDYIDPGHLSLASGSPCYNLDLWMTGSCGLKQSFARGCVGKDLALVEGVMGLFDGTAGGEASTAEVAKILGLPVLLVLSARGISQTIAALARGLLDFDPGLSFLGVVVTEVASARQERLIFPAFEEAGIRCLGFLPRRKDLVLPKRHLGLVLAEETPLETYEKLAALAREFLDLEGILGALKPFSPPTPSPLAPVGRVRVAIARDEAFCFYYQENLDLLREAGAEIVFFSPLRDPLPLAEAYYFGGGYPELYAAKLSRRRDLFDNLLDRYQQGAFILAECGGFMFLNRELIFEGKSYPFCGLLEGEVHFAGRLQALGYREIRPVVSNPLGETPLRGHEFRYSTLKEGESRGFSVFDAFGNRVSTFGVVAERIFASYLHLHFGSNPEAVKCFVSRVAT
ncbi:MAG: cobyrinate a,c-diamide synthase [Thermodesulfobacteria bacterium]|nr:cobyrinate a,c-diamide synthase [Thermodesulfobacteriota bacterium]